MLHICIERQWLWNFGKKATVTKYAYTANTPKNLVKHVETTRTALSSGSNFLVIELGNPNSSTTACDLAYFSTVFANRLAMQLYNETNFYVNWHSLLQPPGIGTFQFNIWKIDIAEEFGKIACFTRIGAPLEAWKIYNEGVDNRINFLFGSNAICCITMVAVSEEVPMSTVLFLQQMYWLRLNTEPKEYEKDQLFFNNCNVNT